MTSSLTVTSSAFSGGAAIPARYTCSGADVSPPISWRGLPGSARSAALTMLDPDAPGGPFVHWVLFNLPPTTTGLAEATVPEGSVQGRNDFGSSGYRGPCPPSGRSHHYHFKLYALDSTLSLAAGSSEAAFQDAINGHVIATGELVGTFKR